MTTEPQQAYWRFYLKSVNVQLMIQLASFTDLVTWSNVTQMWTFEAIKEFYKVLPLAIPWIISFIAPFVTALVLLKYKKD